MMREGCGMKIMGEKYVSELRMMDEKYVSELRMMDERYAFF